LNINNVEYATGMLILGYVRSYVRRNI